MPRLSKDSAPNVQDAGPAVDRSGDLDDTTVSFVTIKQGHSLAPLLRGLPGDSCQCPHWGYLLAGKITVSYADHEETYQAGDAFYMTPGHVPAAETGTGHSSRLSGAACWQGLGSRVTASCRERTSTRGTRGEAGRAAAGWAIRGTRRDGQSGGRSGIGNQGDAGRRREGGASRWLDRSDIRVYIRMYGGTDVTA